MKIRIENSNKPFVTFNEISVGSVFTFAADLAIPRNFCMKIDHNKYNYIELEDYRLGEIDRIYTQVNVFDKSEILIKE